MTQHPFAPRICGVLDSSANAAVADVTRGELTCAPFEHGYLAHGAAVDVARQGSYICAVWGEPRFASAADAALARERGKAVAWLAGFARSGVATLEQLRGRFAVVLLRPSARKAWLACDRFGTWPICYSVDGQRLAFSDRADCVPAADRPISLQALFDYLYFHMIPAPGTVFEGISRLPAGHVLAWEGGTATCEPYWQPHFAEPRSADLDALKREFRGLVRDAVMREAAGGRIGAFLSGGTDSSTIAGMLCSVLGGPAKTYSIGFEASGYDEMQFARIAARHFGTEHHEYYVTPEDLLGGIPRVAAHYDQPFGNSSAVAAWICARNARNDGIEKMLAGDGGDELFGGNTRYAKQRVFDWYHRIPRPLRSAVVEPGTRVAALRRLPLLRKAASYVEQARAPLPDRLQMYNLLLRLGPASVFTPSFIERIDQQAPAAMQRSTWHAVDAHSTINRMLAFDWKYTLADNDLPKVIGTTELAGVEVGFPLLAEELLDFSLGLPPQWKLKGLKLRWFFKEALRGFLPDAIITKQKHGFGLPFGVWAAEHDGLRRLAKDGLDAFAARGVMRPQFLHDLMGRWLPEHPGYYGEMVWIVLVMEQWLQAHAPTFKAD